MKKFYSATRNYWLGGVLLILVSGFMIYHFFDSIWTASIDFSLHYSLVARLSEHWQLGPNNDPSLGEMNTYPRYAHRLGAIAGNLLGSPLAGMQFVVLASLALVWSGLAFLWVALPRRVLLVASGVLVLLLLVNRFLIHLELFGYELVGNYFYPQVVAQAIVMLLIAAALWIERAEISPAVSYVMLAASIPVLQQVHLLPAVEMLGTLALLVLLNAIDSQARNRRNLFLFGLFCIAAAILLTVSSSAFGIMVKNAYDGGMHLRYTPNAATLAVECLIVMALSGLLVWQWIKPGPAETRTGLLTLKYFGLFGAATAAMTLVQIAAFLLGYASLYASQKFAMGLNTVLLLGASLLPALWMASAQTAPDHAPGDRIAAVIHLFRQAIPAMFVLLGLLTVLPAPVASNISLHELLSVERSVKSYSLATPTGTSKKYEYAIGLFPGVRQYHDVLDYWISTGVLKSPRVDNADDILNSHPLSQPNQIIRIFTRAGSQPWDIAGCRRAELEDNVIVLDGQCVIKTLQEAGITTGLGELAFPHSAVSASFGS